QRLLIKRCILYVMDALLHIRGPAAFKNQIGLFFGLCAKVRIFKSPDGQQWNLGNVFLNLAEDLPPSQCFTKTSVKGILFELIFKNTSGFLLKGNFIRKYK